MVFFTKTAENFFLIFFLQRFSKNYDGASVNSRKKNSNFFLHRFFTKTAEFFFLQRFSKNSRKKKFKFFSPTFFQKQQKKN